MSVEELTKVDALCCEGISTMPLDQVVRLLNIFRQIKRRGNFVEQAAQLIIGRQANLEPKHLLMVVISLLELGNQEAVQHLEPTILANVAKPSGFSR